MQTEIYDIRTDIELEAFRITYQRQKQRSKENGKNKTSNDINKMYKEQTDRQDKLIR